MRPLANDDPGREEQAGDPGGDHFHRRAQPGLAQGEVWDEMGSVLQRHAARQGCVLGHKDVVVPGPYILEVEQLAHVTAPGRRKADPQSPRGPVIYTRHATQAL